jgi:predicted amidohydrolase YtcJ
VVGRTSFGRYARVTEDRRFTRHDLDALSQEHPIAVLAGLHVAMLNTRALQALGLWDAQGTPRGALIHREPSGAPTGVATEIWNLLPAFGLEETTEAIRAKAAERFLANGVTSVHTSRSRPPTSPPTTRSSGPASCRSGSASTTTCRTSSRSTRCWTSGSARASGTRCRSSAA